MPMGLILTHNLCAENVVLCRLQRKSSEPNNHPRQKCKGKKESITTAFQWWTDFFRSIQLFDLVVRLLGCLFEFEKKWMWFLLQHPLLQIYKCTVQSKTVHVWFRRRGEPPCPQIYHPASHVLDWRRRRKDFPCAKTPGYSAAKRSS